jgi:hypothetical protein
LEIADLLYMRAAQALILILAAWPILQGCAGSGSNGSSASAAAGVGSHGGLLLPLPSEKGYAELLIHY